MIRRALLLTLLACDADPRAPVYVPENLDTIPVGDCDSFTLEVFMGPTTPLPAQHIVARCAVPTACNAEIRQEGRVIIHGVGVGTTMVLVAFDHPTTHEHVERRIPVAVNVPRSGDTLHPRMVQPPACD